MSGNLESPPPQGGGEVEGALGVTGRCHLMGSPRRLEVRSDARRRHAHTLDDRNNHKHTHFFAPRCGLAADASGAPSQAGDEVRQAAGASTHGARKEHMCARFMRVGVGWPPPSLGGQEMGSGERPRPTHIQGVETGTLVLISSRLGVGWPPTCVVRHPRIEVRSDERRASTHP
jgi:hypothetical protein